MSLGYAEKLSYREDVGTVGQKEHLDDDSAVQSKCSELARLLRDSKKTVIMTGAGISTASGIPDFRGPNGVWTCQKYGRPLPKLDTTFASALPTLTHMCIVGLLRDGPAEYIVSQNVDGLHRRSGIAASQLAEVHGNCFMERCPSCGTYYMRDFEMVTVGFKPTGRKCTKGRCRGNLKDQVLDWEDALPEEQLEAAEEHANTADLVLCLGTSLQIRPICNLPLNTKRQGGKIVIVNLQKTPKNKAADLVIHAKCDQVMQSVMNHMGRTIPCYDRWDHYQIRFWMIKAKVNGKRSRQDPSMVRNRTLTTDECSCSIHAPLAQEYNRMMQAMLQVALSSSHGMTCPMPMLQSIEWRFSEPTNASNGNTSTLKMQECAIKPDVNNIQSAEASIQCDPAEHGSPMSTCKGDAYVDGAEGPAVLTFSMPEATDRQPERIILQLMMHLGPGADVQYRTHVLDIQIHVDLVPKCVQKSKMDAAWAAAEHGTGQISLRSQACDPPDDLPQLDGSLKWPRLKLTILEIVDDCH